MVKMDEYRSEDVENFKYLKNNSKQSNMKNLELCRGYKLDITLSTKMQI